MNSKSLVLKGIALIFVIILIQGCGPSEPEPINTDFKVEFKTRTFGAGAKYMIPNKGVINKDGSMEFSDLKVEDTVRKCLCDYQKINCNGASSKVIIKNINQSLANYVFINDTYKGKTKDPSQIAEAIMQKMEKAGVISINERVKDIPRYIVEAIDETKLKSHFRKENPKFKNQTRCDANQTQRNNTASFADMKHLANTKQFMGELSFCLGVDIFIDDSIKNNKLLNRAVLFDIETTDQPEKLIPTLAKYGLTLKRYDVKSFIVEVNVTPQMINLTKEGLRKR